MRKIGMAVLAGLLMSAVSAVFADEAPQAQAAQKLEAQARETWREAIVRTAVPEAACFHASYPSTVWTKVECTVAPNRPYLPRHAGISRAETAGDGNDIVADVSGVITGSVGTFPKVTGVKRERDGLRQNVYSLQLNSNFMTTAACNGISGCLSWEQFVYSSSENVAFMQYWLIDYGTCQSGWITAGKDCYKNSAAVSAPKEAISELANLKISATAVLNGIDTMVFTTDTDAYSTTGADSVVDLATDWHQSEFNIVGDGGGSKASFNRGSSITVKIAVTDGTKTTPSCAGDSGTTGETNNLTLGTCTASGGSTPSIQFTESN